MVKVNHTEPRLYRCCGCEDESSKYVKSFPWRMRNGFVSETRTESGDRDLGRGDGHGNGVALGAHEEPGEEVIIMDMCKELSEWNLEQSLVGKREVRPDAREVWQLVESLREELKRPEE